MRLRCLAMVCQLAQDDLRNLARTPTPPRGCDPLHPPPSKLPHGFAISSADSLCGFERFAHLSPLHTFERPYTNRGGIHRTCFPTEAVPRKSDCGFRHRHMQDLDALMSVENKIRH